jgi:hypothetical protein
VSEAATTGRLRAGSLASVATVAAYAVLGLLLLVTRFVGLDRSLWHDELLAVLEYVRPGLGEILTGGVNHELFTLLEWVTSKVVGESEAAFRLWSTVPFVAGVAVATTWLHRRVDPLSGVLFLFLATVSPLLLDITRQARGYGLAFLAMSVLVVAALEADRSGRTWTVVALCAAGVAGTWTLPNFGIAFLAVGGALLTSPDLRRRTAIGLGLSALAIVAIYAPHLGELTESSQVEYGVRIGLLAVVTAPIDQILIPAFLWIDGTVLVAGLVWLPVVALALLLLASSPLLRVRRTALILVSGVVATIIVFWAAQLYVVPRYLSYLLVPLFMLLATGTSAVLARLTTRPAIVRTVVAFAMLVLLAVGFATTAPDIVRLPREAHRDTAEAIVREAQPGARIVANMHNPVDLDYYLDLPLVAAEGAAVVPAVCNAPGHAIYVHQPFVVETVDVPCLTRPGVRRVRFEQYTRGGEISAWFIPPATN